MSGTYKLIIILVAITFQGCFSFGSRSAPTPPDLAEEKETVREYEETKRQAIVATDVLLEQAKKRLREDMPEIEEKPEPDADDESEFDPESSDFAEVNEPEDDLPDPVPFELEAAHSIVKTFRKVFGEPANPVSMAENDVKTLPDRVKSRGMCARGARNKIEKKTTKWIKKASKDEGGMFSGFWNKMKLIGLGLLIVVGIAGFIFINMQYGKLMSTIFAVVFGAVIIVYVLMFYWQYVLLVGGVAAMLVVLYIIYGAYRETGFSKNLIRDVQNGRRALSEEERTKWNKAVKSNMRKSHQKTVEKRKKLQDIDPVSEKKDGLVD